jgi:hypothetical protein
MSPTIELFEQYKHFRGVQADRLAAQMLGVKSQTVSNWRTRGSQAEPWLVEKMCLALGQEATPWLVRILAEQATSAHNRKVWERVGASLGYRMASVLALAVIPVAWLIRLAEGVEDADAGMRLLKVVFGFGEAMLGL